MKILKTDLDVDFIGSPDSMTKEELKIISNYLRDKNQHLHLPGKSIKKPMQILQRKKFRQAQTA